MTSVDPFEPTPIALATSARLTINQHAAQPGGRFVPEGSSTCDLCTPQGCPQLAWAEQTLAEQRPSGRR